MFSMKKSMLAGLSALVMLAGAHSALARTITDQIGRTVDVPDTVERAVVLQHQTLNILTQIDANGVIVGVLDSWQKNLGKGFVRFMPSLATMPTPGSLRDVNIESLMALKPDVVFVANYAPQSMIDKITKAGIPVVAVSLRSDAAGEKAKLNPDMDDADAVYTQGLAEGIRMIGTIVGKSDNAEKLIGYVTQTRKIAADRLKDLKPEDRVRTYMANPNLATYGAGKYVGVMMNRAGANNVAAASIKGYKTVSIEQVIDWNPSVIFVQNRFPQVVTEVKDGPVWQKIDAVANGRIYLMPEYAKAWGYPQPEALALGELWMAKKLYPARFTDIDMDKLADDYYRKFYRVSWLDGHDQSK